MLFYLILCLNKVLPVGFDVALLLWLLHFLCLDSCLVLLVGVVDFIWFGFSWFAGVG